MKPHEKTEAPDSFTGEAARGEGGVGDGEGMDSPATDEGRETPEQRIAGLEALAEQKTREAKESYDRYVREVAEGENFRKRMQRDKADSIRHANESLLRDVLPIVDNLEWALVHASETGDASIIEGVKLTLKMFRDVLERHGVTEIEITPGAPFDPVLHEAVGVEARPDMAPNTVLRVQQRGYRLRDRLLRAARVAVSAA